MLVVEPALDIVVVDDSDGDRLITGVVLERSRLTNPVVLLGSAQEAITYLERIAAERRPPPALVMLDVNMHGMTGFDVLEFIRRHDAFAQRPLVAMLTSSDADRDEARATELGANAFLAKKSGVSAFVAMIDANFENRA